MPNNVENYNKLEQVIQAANPEIMELKFGCIISTEINDYFCMDSLYCVPYVNETPQFFWRGYPKAIHSIKPSIKILGRPIRLADVLLAIEHYGVENPNGSIIFTWADLVNCWNLKNDNLDNQSEETKQFLIDLLTDAV